MAEINPVSIRTIHSPSPADLLVRQSVMDDVADPTVPWRKRALGPASIWETETLPGRCEISIATSGLDPDWPSARTNLFLATGHCLMGCTGTVIEGDSGIPAWSAGQRAVAFYATHAAVNVEIDGLRGFARRLSAIAERDYPEAKAMDAQATRSAIDAAHEVALEDEAYAANAAHDRALTAMLRVEAETIRNGDRRARMAAMLDGTAGIAPSLAPAGEPIHPDQGMV